MNSSTFGYDSASRLQTVTNGTNVATYGYLANAGLVQTIAYTQGAATRLTTTKAYDNLNRLQGISATPSASAAIQAAYLYNSANQRTRLTREDSAYWNYGYDALGQVTTGQKRLADGSGALGNDYAYTYDDIGNRKTATTNGQQSTYSATLLNTYLQRTVPGSLDIYGTAAADATVAVTFPATGGTITLTTRQGETFFAQLPVNNASTAQYPAVKISGVKNNVGAAGEDAVTEITKSAFVAKTPEVFTHDADGNLTQDAKWTYTWDAENRLVTMETVAAAVTAGVPKQKLEFAYDAASRRIQKKVSNWSGSAYALASDTRFLYDGWNLIAELGTSGSLVRSYVWGLDLSGSNQGAGGVGGVLAVNNGSATCFPTFDGNGNIIGLVNASTGTLDASFEYDPFGNTIKSVGAAANVQPFGFSTKYTDTETSLCYYGLRYYNTATGRWPNRDPIEEQGGLNLYRVVDNNIINRVDCLGLVDCRCAKLKKILERVKKENEKPRDLLDAMMKQSYDIYQLQQKDGEWGGLTYLSKDGYQNTTLAKGVESDPNNSGQYTVRRSQLMEVYKNATNRTFAGLNHGHTTYDFEEGQLSLQDYQVALQFNVPITAVTIPGGFYKFDPTSLDEKVRAKLRDAVTNANKQNDEDGKANFPETVFRHLDKDMMDLLFSPDLQIQCPDLYKK